MKASPWEKLILVMLSDLHAKAGIKGSVDPKLVASAAENDELWVLAWKYPFMGLGNDTPDDVTFVVDVLDMFSFLSTGYSALDPAEQKALIAAHAHAETAIKFRGFDGNNEPEYRNIARRLVEDLDRFDSMKDVATLNSHSRMADVYRRMLTAFEPIRARLGMREMNATEIGEILSAWAYR